MGVSNDGLLVFGFELEEEGSNPDWLGSLSFDEYVIEKAGMTGNEPYEQ